MRRMYTIVLLLGLVALVTGTTLAQGQRGKGRGFGGGMGGGGVAGLLTNEGVQKELKLDADQVTKVKDAVAKVREKHASDFAGLRDASREERQAKMQDLNRTVSTETLAAVKDVLKPDQLKRLHQIELQTGGVRALSRPEVQTALSLNADQKEKVKTITDDLQKDTREALQGGGGGNFQEARAKMQAMNKEAMEKVSSLLTDSQKKTWKEMTGEPFTVQFQPGQGGQGKGRRRNNQ